MKSRHFSFRIPLALYHDLKAHANKVDRSIGWILAQAAQDYLARASKKRAS